MSIPQARTGPTEESERSLRILEKKRERDVRDLQGHTREKETKEIQLDSKKANKEDAEFIFFTKIKP